MFRPANLLLAFLLAPLLFPLAAQDTTTVAFTHFSTDDLNDAGLTTFLAPYLENTQFVMVGEQHFIREAGEFTKAVYERAQAYDYRRLCIENDALAAQRLTALAGAEDPLRAAADFYRDFPTTLAFYENEEDYELLSYVVRSGGELWGIDQTLMAQFRYNFSYLIDNSRNEELVAYLRPLLEKARAGYTKTMTEKDFSALYFFQYDPDTAARLSELATDEPDREIIRQLNLTKEIYDHNFARRYYLNNHTRGTLMKANFMRYYRAAREDEELPKVVFKLGSYHTYRGLTPTNIYDISNLVAELAASNGYGSLHVRLTGISGRAGVGFPLAPEPVVDFDNTNDFPPEVRAWIKEHPLKKYNVLDLTQLRPTAHLYSEELRKMIFAHDLLVLVKDARAITAF